MTNRQFVWLNARRVSFNLPAPVPLMTNFVQFRRITDDNRVFIDMPDSPDNPCISCGACCAHFRVSFYCGELAGASGNVVPADMVSKVNALIVCMKGTEAGNGRCIALVGELGKPGISCSIYGNRPSPCREFANWLDDGSPNPDCQRLRSKIGLPPLNALLPRALVGGGELPGNTDSSLGPGY